MRLVAHYAWSVVARAVVATATPATVNVVTTETAAKTPYRTVTDVVVMMVVVIWTPRVIVTAPTPPEVYAPATAVADVPVPIVPRVTWIAVPRVEPRVITVPATPAIIPRRVEQCCGVCCTPGAEHRSDVTRLNPHLVARYHHVVERWVVGCCIGVVTVVTQVEV